MAQQEKPHKSCGTFAARLTTRASVAFGQPVRLRGLLMSSAGMPIAGQPVAILTAPDNGSNAFTQAAAVTTGAGWQLDGDAAARPVADHRGRRTRARRRSCPPPGLRP